MAIHLEVCGGLHNSWRSAPQLAEELRDARPVRSLLGLGLRMSLQEVPQYYQKLTGML